MNINDTLTKETSKHLYKYDCDPVETQQFLMWTGNFVSRQKIAIEIIRKAVTVHGKQRLYNHMVELAEVEYGIRRLKKQLRDHVVHSVLSFMLGIYINEYYSTPEKSTYVDPFQWKLAGLFHDIAYPIEIANYLAKPFGEEINKLGRELDPVAPTIRFSVIPGATILQLTNGINSFSLIQPCLDRWGLQIDAKGEYDRMIGSGRICHGIVSSLAVLWIIDRMYQKYNPEREYKDIILYEKSGATNWNQTFFEESVVSACSAIYIHNLCSECFDKAKINPPKAPLAFLLRLADSLQEWERPSLGKPDGLPPSLFDIHIEGEQIVFHADISREEKTGIENTLFSYLSSVDVLII